MGKITPIFGWKRSPQEHRSDKCFRCRAERLRLSEYQDKLASSGTLHNDKTKIKCYRNLYSDNVLTIPEKTKLKTTIQCLSYFFFIIGKPQREKYRHHKKNTKKNTIALISVNIEHNNCVSSRNISIYT